MLRTPGENSDSRRVILEKNTLNSELCLCVIANMLWPSLMCTSEKSQLHVGNIVNIEDCDCGTEFQVQSLSKQHRRRWAEKKHLSCWRHLSE